MISNTTYIATATGDGTTVTFSFPFEILANSDLQVNLINTSGTIIPQVLGTNYSVSINPSSEGGSITFGSAPTLNYTVQIMRIRPFTQSVSLVTEAALPAQQIENQLDSMTMLCIQVNGVVQSLLTAFGGVVPAFNVFGISAIPTIASAATINIGGIYGAVILSGTTGVSTISGGFIGQQLTFICTGGLTFGTGGNISTSKAVAANVAASLIFDGTNWHHIT